MVLFAALWLFFFCVVHCTEVQVIHEYDFHPLPIKLPSHHVPSSENNKFIPKLIWIAVKDEKDELPGHLKDFFARNPDWKVNICDNNCKDRFMNETFQGTSIHWAYYMINPAVGASRADIWRYSVLYTFGGLYLDDDSDIKTPLNEISSTIFQLCYYIRLLDLRKS